MRITRAGEYGVLGLFHLARCPQQSAMLEDVSRAEKIPKSFLGKIFQQLVRVGLIQSTRGVGGGFRLKMEPARISILEVVEAIEGRIAFQRCLQEDSGCEHVGGCALCSLFEQAQDQVKEVLARTTLEDLLRKQSAGPAHRLVTRVPRFSKFKTLANH